VRMGIPQNVMGLPEVVRNPIYSTGIGLLIYGKEHQSYGRNIEVEGTSWWAKIKNWFQGNF
jgi:cell division protein FtsA